MKLKTSLKKNADTVVSLAFLFRKRALKKIFFHGSIEAKQIVLTHFGIQVFCMVYTMLLL